MNQYLQKAFMVSSSSDNGSDSEYGNDADFQENGGQLEKTQNTTKYAAKYARKNASQKLDQPAGRTTSRRACPTAITPTQWAVIVGTQVDDGEWANMLSRKMRLTVEWST
jgi:hypothetical protein